MIKLKILTYEKNEYFSKKEFKKLVVTNQRKELCEQKCLLKKMDELLHDRVEYTE